MNTWVVKIKVPLKDAEDLSALLFEIGAEGVEIQDHEMIKNKDTILPESGFAFLMASFQSDTKESIKQDIQDAFVDTSYSFHIESIEPPSNVDWEAHWKTFFKPICISERLWIKPSWETQTTDKNTKTVVLDPEMAFGTGSHPTTKLCLKALDLWLLEQSSTPLAHILDVGTGSGILSIAAALLSSYSITAFDNDAPSVDIAIKNAVQNHCDNKIKFFHFDLLENNNSLHPIVQHRYDLILANILADPLILMADKLISLCNKKTTFILSGILKTQQSQVITAYEQRGLKTKDLWQEEEWVAIVMDFSKVGH